MELQQILFVREYEMPVFYKDRHMGTRRVDFLIADKISLELKALAKLEPVHFTQAINYLEAYNIELGLLINFGSVCLDFHRVVNKKYKS